MAELNTQAVSHDQLAAVAGMIDEFIVTRADLAEFADAVEGALPALVARSAGMARQKSEPRSWKMQVIRDASNLIVEVLVSPMEGAQ